MTVTENGHVIRISSMPTFRYRVECETCHELIRNSTISPDWAAFRHASDSIDLESRIIDFAADWLVLISLFLACWIMAFGIDLR